jgi:plastocyanin
MRRFILTTILISLPIATTAQEVHDVTVRDNFFEPKHLTITAGDTVRWTNQGANAHNVVEDNGMFRCAGGCDSGSGTGTAGYANGESPGDPSTGNWSFELTFDNVGQVGYYCEVHGLPGVGMFGTITVEAAGDDEPEGQPINFGMTGSWFNPETNGQGIILDVVTSGDPPSLHGFWFTFDLDGNGGPPGLRWLTTGGKYEEGDSMVVMEVYLVVDGAFDLAEPPATDPQTIGMAELNFESCTDATLTYDLDFDGDPDLQTSGSIPLQRLTPDEMCESLANDGSDN